MIDITQFAPNAMMNRGRMMGRDPRLMPPGDRTRMFAARGMGPQPGMPPMMRPGAMPEGPSGAMPQGAPVGQGAPAVPGGEPGGPSGMDQQTMMALMRMLQARRMGAAGTAGPRG